MTAGQKRCETPTDCGGLAYRGICEALPDSRAPLCIVFTYAGEPPHTFSCVWLIHTFRGVWSRLSHNAYIFLKDNYRYALLPTHQRPHRPANRVCHAVGKDIFGGLREREPAGRRRDPRSSYPQSIGVCSALTRDE